ncbi:GDSL-type esterase/lipase family protein [Neolewinella antarctica]|uniref:Lysophospholipase L1-like esterase n=1 Tax=Neolewinella antarctica TaxID=442734 RepID=A0ABX0X721_9BACT|nr:GDSL-type esterase/lipase family protein [Neolewinella antarctica]NJC24784.1 lysophospholipase L1-like esterase [Neolewinella antarctica]
MPINYLALGDSYTIGTDVATTECWPRQLLNRLTNGGILPTAPEDTSLTIVAEKGWTTGDLLAGIKESDLLPAYDLVSVQIGVNNQYDGLTLADFKVEFADILGKALQLAGGDASKVFVVSIPDYAFTPTGGGQPSISEAVGVFNAAAAAIATRAGIIFCDIIVISRGGIREPALVASDGLHPSGLQYRRWVEEVLLNLVSTLLKG